MPNVPTNEKAIEFGESVMSAFGGDTQGFDKAVAANRKAEAEATGIMPAGTASAGSVYKKGTATPNVPTNDEFPDLSKASYSVARTARKPASDIAKSTPKSNLAPSPANAAKLPKYKFKGPDVAEIPLMDETE